MSPVKFLGCGWNRLKSSHVSTWFFWKAHAVEAAQHQPLGQIGADWESGGSCNKKIWKIAIWVFPKIGVPLWGYPYFWKHPYIYYIYNTLCIPGCLLLRELTWNKIFRVFFHHKWYSWIFLRVHRICWLWGFSCSWNVITSQETHTQNDFLWWFETCETWPPLEKGKYFHCKKKWFSQLGLKPPSR